MDSNKHINVNLSHLLKGEEKVIRNLLVPFDTRFGCVAEVLTTGAVPWKDLGNTFERFWCYSHLTAVELSLVIRQAGSARNEKVKPDFEKSGVDSQEEDFYQVEGHVEGV